MRLFSAFLKFARPQILVSCYALVVLGSLVAGSFNWKIILAFMLVTFAIVHANSINDYSDRQIDEINLKSAKDRPLVSGDISDREFWLLHYGSAAATLLLAVFFGAPAVLLTVVLIICDYIYSLKPIRLTDRPFASPLVLAFLYTYYPLSLGFWSANRQEAYPWLLSLGIFLAFGARMLLKDFRDIKGDKKFGKKTFLIRFGVRATCATSAVLWFLAFAVTIYALDFNIGVFLPLPFGLFQVYLLLNALQRTSNTDDQNKIITFIANAANFSIAAIFISVLVRHQFGFSSLESALTPAIVGSTLLLFNLISYLAQRRQFALTA